ncbi:MAG: hypothetical protein H0V17_31155 [Deltaproteobacteria bacterium]|nr:hypothetical protein [Deltaproteobacteria bacterium]
MLATVAGAAIVRRVTTPEPDRTDEARQHAESLARVWAPDSAPACPVIRGKYWEPGAKARLDPWGNNMKMVCGKALPIGRRVMVVSAGPDGVFDTGDDIRSDF